MHHYAQHQELESIIQMVAACGIWCYVGYVLYGLCVIWVMWVMCYVGYVSGLRAAAARKPDT